MLLAAAVLAVGAEVRLDAAQPLGQMLLLPVQPLEGRLELRGLHLALALRLFEPGHGWAWVGVGLGARGRGRDLGWGCCGAGPDLRWGWARGEGEDECRRPCEGVG